MSSDLAGLVEWCGASSPVLRLARGRQLCQSLKTECARPWKTVAARLAANPDAKPIIALSDPETPCGLGTDLTERSGVVTIAAAARRPLVLFENPAEPLRRWMRPHPSLTRMTTSQPLDPTIVMDTFDACNATLARALKEHADAYGAQPLSPHECMGIGFTGKWGHKYVIQPVFTGQLSRRDGGYRTGQLFLRTQALHFVSHNSMGAFGPLLLHKVPAGLKRGMSESSGGTCMLALLMWHMSEEALEAAVKRIERASQHGKVRVHALNIRRGDSAISRECKTCVAPDEPDVHSADRIFGANLLTKLAAFNASLGAVGSHGVYVASDTLEGYEMARRALRTPDGTPTPLAIVTANDDGPKRQPVHSTQLKADADTKHLLAEVASMVLADEVYRLGDSSLSSCASSLGSGHTGRSLQ